MSKSQFSRVKASLFSNRMPVIGFLTENLASEFHAKAWHAISEAAHDFNLNVLCLCGNSLHYAKDDSLESKGHALYSHLFEYYLDGLIISTSFFDDVPCSVQENFYTRIKHVPVVSLSPTELPVTQVVVNYRTGVESLMRHCIVDHKYTKFAFVCNAESHAKEDERFLYCKEILKHHAIDLQPKAIFYGECSRKTGADAVDQCFQAHVQPEVIVACNDEIALGVIESLQIRGIKVPGDIAIVGFGDIEESLCASPPLTTVNHEFSNLGKTATKVLYDLLVKNDVPQKITIEPRLVIRQSCGCILQSGTPSLERSENSSIHAHDDLVSTLEPSTLLPIVSKGLDVSFVECTEIITAFCYDVNNRKEVLFLRTLHTVCNSLISSQGNLDQIQYLLINVWKYVVSHLERSSSQFADELIHKSHNMRENVLMRNLAARHMQRIRNQFRIHQMGDKLKNCPDKEHLIQSLSTQLPQAKIDTFFLTLADTNSFPESKSRLSLWYCNGKNRAMENEEIIFQTHTLLPESTIVSNSNETVIVQPILFKKEHYGMLFLKYNKEYLEFYDLIQYYVSSAFHSVLLLETVQKQSEKLILANKELEQLRLKELEHLEGIKSELEFGRKIQMGFLPHRLPNIEGWDISVAFIPAREVSGDFYDVFLMDDQTLAIVIGDVSGKDVSAALFMSLISTLIRVFSERAKQDGANPLQAIDIVNDYILRHHRQAEGRCMFATVFFGLINLQTGQFTYINAGHNAPLILENQKIIQDLPPTGAAVGLAMGLTFRQQQTIIKPGNLLFAFTDGVIESQNKNGDFYSMNRLVRVVTSEKDSTAESIVRRIDVDLSNHRKDASPFDDVTILSLYRL